MLLVNTWMIKIIENTLISLYFNMYSNDYIQMQICVPFFNNNTNVHVIFNRLYQLDKWTQIIVDIGLFSVNGMNESLLMGHLSHTINNLHLDCFETSTLYIFEACHIITWTTESRLAVCLHVFSNQSLWFFSIYNTSPCQEPLMCSWPCLWGFEWGL